MDYVRLIRNVLDLEKNVMMVRNSAALDALFHGMSENHKLVATNIDMWIIGDWDWSTLEQSVALLLQHAYIMQRATGKRTKLRIIQMVQYFFSEEQYKLHKGLNDLVSAARIPMPELIVMTAPAGVQPPRGGLPTRMAEADIALKYYKSLNHLIFAKSSNTVLTFVALPAPPDYITVQFAVPPLSLALAKRAGTGNGNGAVLFTSLLFELRAAPCCVASLTATCARSIPCDSAATRHVHAREYRSVPC